MMKKKKIQSQNYINAKYDTAKNAERNKANNSPNKTESKDVKLKTIKKKKIRV